jgi:hexokinase
MTDLGEILLHFIDASLLFNGYSSTILNTHYGYDAAFVSAVEGAKSLGEIKTIIVKQLDVDEAHVTENCSAIVQWACHVVASRAAALAACAIAAVITHTGNDKVPEGETDTGVDVGLDGR